MYFSRVFIRIHRSRVIVSSKPKIILSYNDVRTKIFNRFHDSLFRIRRNSITADILLFKFELFFPLEDGIRELILRLKISHRSKKINKFHELPRFDVLGSLQQI